MQNCSSMSKAFTREDDDGDLNDEVDGVDEGDESLKVPGGKNYITPTGFARLREELAQLLNVERPKLVETVAWAASNGDRSENADYIYGKRRLREIDRRIRFLTKRLEAAEVVDPMKQPKDKVLFGNRVEVEDEDGTTRVYQIVGVDETNASEGQVSWTSPVGKALLQARVGDVVQLHTPKGEHELEILKIT